MQSRRTQLTPWAELTEEEREEIRKEFEVHVTRAGADLSKGLYRNTPEDYKRMGARGHWVMAYC